MKILPKISLPGLLIAALLVASPLADARQDEVVALPALAPLFADQTPLAVKIEAPLTTLMTERPDEDYLDGTFTYINGDGTEQLFDLKIRTRGNFRRQDKICDFTPIRLNFRKKQVKDTLLDGQDKLKLVTHCKSGVTYNEQLLLREYMAYRFFQVMTDVSFSVRLLQITYVDTEGADPMTKYGFVLEDNDAVAERLGMESIKSPDITHDDLDPAHDNLVNVFQYMIGNTDFSLINGEPGEECCHNAELLSASVGPPFTPLPYDFDFAGMVNASYAVSNPQFKLKSVRQRLYRGRCNNNNLLPATLQQFLDKREVFYAIIDELDMLGSRSRKDVTAYLDSFFKHISNQRGIQARFIERCS